MKGGCFSSCLRLEGSWDPARPAPHPDRVEVGARLLEGLGDFLFVASPGLERGAGLYLEASLARWTHLLPLRVLTPGLLLLYCPSCVFQAGALGSSAPEIIGSLLGHVHPSLGSVSQMGSGHLLPPSGGRVCC